MFPKPFTSQRFPALVKYTAERGRKTYILIYLFPDNYAKIIGEMQLCDLAVINILHSYVHLYIYIYTHIIQVSISQEK